MMTFGSPIDPTHDSCWIEWRFSSIQHIIHDSSPFATKANVCGPTRIMLDQEKTDDQGKTNVSLSPIVLMGTSIIRFSLIPHNICDIDHKS